MSNPFVVKVQKSIVTTMSKRQMMIYDFTRSVQFQGDLDPEVDKAMGSRLKAFFWAVLNHNGEIELQGPPLKEDGTKLFESANFQVMNTEVARSER